MSRTESKIRFKAKLLRPAAPGKGASWAFLILPKVASAKLPTRGLTTVKGTINDYPFRAKLEADGQRSHWLKVNRKMREAAGAQVGDVVTLEIMPTGERSETRVCRIENACEMLVAGKRRVCCFDRSGFYSKSFGAPEAAD